MLEKIKTDINKKAHDENKVYYYMTQLFAQAIKQN